MPKIYMGSLDVLMGATEQEHTYLFYDPDTDSDGDPTTGTGMQILRGGTGANHAVPLEINILVEIESLAQSSRDWFAPGETAADRNFRVLADGAAADTLWANLQGFATSLGTANDPLPGLYDTGITYNIADLNSNSIINSLLNAAGYDFITHTPWAEGAYGTTPQNPETFPGFMTLIDGSGNNTYTAFANSLVYGDEYKFYKRDGNDLVMIEQQAAQVTVKNSSRLDDDGTTHIKIMWGTMDQFDIGLGLFGDLLVKDGTNRILAQIDNYGTYAANKTILEFSDYVYRRGDGAANTLVAINGKSHVLEGWGGHDTLTGGAGSDILHGGDGNDTYIRSGGSDILIENTAQAGADIIHFGAGVYRNQLIAYWDSDVQMIYLHDQSHSWGMFVSGTYTAATAITAAIAVSFIEQGRDAANAVFDIAGLVRSYTSEGFSQQAANVHPDNIYFIPWGETNFTGSDEDDLVYGTWLPEAIVGGMGNDELHGGDGNDELYGGYGDDTLYGGAGDDTLIAYMGSDMLYGGDGNDTFENDGGLAVLIGGADSDTYNISIGIGTSVWLREVASDAGNDTVNFTMWSGSYERHYNAGTNDHNHLQIVFNQNNSSALFGRIILEGYFSGQNPFENVIRSGSNGAAPIAFTLPYDVIKTYGSSAGDEIYGVSGLGIGAGAINDRIFAQGGNDTVFAGSGNDYVSGGTGNDILYGGDGIDTLYGDIGNDTLVGDVGSDTLSGGRGADTFIFNALSMGAMDTITDFTAAENDKIDLSELVSFDPLTESIGDFVRLTEQSGSSRLQVDRDGAGTAYGWENVALLQGVVGLNVENIIVTSND
ncbi:MAG: type I secretion C-terminal target domain-containing protein [Pseudomonadota bacterium]